MITMYISATELKNLKEKGKGIASTFRTDNGDFQINVDINKIDLDTHDKGMYCDHYYIGI